MTWTQFYGKGTIFSVWDETGSSTLGDMKPTLCMSPFGEKTFLRGQIEEKEKNRQEKYVLISAMFKKCFETIFLKLRRKSL